MDKELALAENEREAAELAAFDALVMAHQIRAKADRVYLSLGALIQAMRDHQETNTTATGTALAQALTDLEAHRHE